MGDCLSIFPPKNRYDGRGKGCLGLMPFQIFMRSQIFNYSIREGPQQSNHWVHEALVSKKINWLQVAFVDAVYALGGRCHGFGPWNPCPVRSLRTGEVLYVEFNSGWHAGHVLRKVNETTALVQFHSDNSQFHVHDKIHTFALHPPAHIGPSLAPRELHSSLAPPLSTLPLPLPVYPFPYRSTPVGSSEERHLFKFHDTLPPLQVSDLRVWGCTSVVVQALEHPQSTQWLWVYIDGSWDDPLAGSAAVLVWPDGLVLVLAIPCPYDSSKDAEFWAFVQVLTYLTSVGFTGTVSICIDNSQLVTCVDWDLSGTPIPPASMSTQSTWQKVVHSVLESVKFSVGVG